MSASQELDFLPAVVEIILARIGICSSQKLFCLMSRLRSILNPGQHLGVQEGCAELKKAILQPLTPLCEREHFGVTNRSWLCAEDVPTCLGTILVALTMQAEPFL